MVELLSDAFVVIVGGVKGEFVVISLLSSSSTLFFLIIYAYFVDLNFCCVSIMVGIAA